MTALVRRGHPRWGLAVLTLPVILVSMDFSVLYLAMPTITEALEPSATAELWVLDIYGFLIAGLLITMGNVGDRIGRRRILLAGAAVFGVASVLAVFAPSAGFLIAARALMGVGGATLLPSSLSLIANMFPDPGERGRAIGVWTAAFAGGAAVGPVIGGVLLHHFWWGSVFLINLPVLAVLFLAGPVLLPEFRAATTHRFDVAGVVFSLLGILPAVYAVKTLAAEGFSPTRLGVGIFGLVMLAVFLGWERRVDDPLLKLSLFGNPAFSAAVAAAFFGMFAQGGMAYLGNVYLQSVLGHDVLAAALAGLPMAVTVAVFSVGADRVKRLLGVRTALAAAVLLAGLGNLGFLFLSPGTPIAAFLATTALAGIGYGVQFALVSDVVVAAAPPEQSGAAAGTSETCFELGTAMGLAVLGSVATAVFLAGDHGRGFGHSLGETLHRAGDAGPAGQALAEAARSAWVDGLHVAAGVSGGVLVVLAAVVAIALNRLP